MKKVLIYMSAALLLSSCGLYNKYERPEVKDEGLVRDPVSITDTLAVQDTISFGNMPWRTVFTDPQLQALIEQGLENNPDLLNAALNVKMVNEALKVAKLAFLPSVVLSPQGTLSSFDGAAARLRPILMTSLAMVIGLLPMMFASGVGKNGNQTLGAAAVGGMLIGTLLQIFVVPSLFVIFQSLQEKISPLKFEDEENAEVAAELAQYAHKKPEDYELE